MPQISLFIFSFIVWNLLVWPFDANGVIILRDIIGGAFISLIVALVMREFTTQKFHRWTNPLRVFWFIIYCATLVYYIVRANLDVAYRILHPAMPIRPGVLKLHTSLTTETAITMLANSITLTPGTHTIDAHADGTIYVHWLNVKTSNPDKANKMIVGRFEWLLKKIFE